jgi:hypothetical protein
MHSGGKDDNLPPGAHIPWIANYLREHNPNKYVPVYTLWWWSWRWCDAICQLGSGRFLVALAFALLIFVFVVFL